MKIKTLDEFKSLAEDYAAFGNLLGKVAMSKMMISIYDLLLKILSKENKKLDCGAWIDVEDKLPERYETVLVAHNVSKEKETRLDVTVGYLGDADEFFGGIGWTINIGDVYYWRPFPKAPNVE